MRATRLISYIWALPTTLIGSPFVVLALITGGRARVFQGVLEVHGGGVAYFLRNATLLKGGARAMTLGHIVLGLDRDVLRSTRRHERVHVRQVERWGPFFIPAYLLASAWIAFRGGEPYLDNPFEREAFRRYG